MQCFSLEILLGNLLKNVVSGVVGGGGDEALYHRGFLGAVVSLRRIWICLQPVCGINSDKVKIWLSCPVVLKSRAKGGSGGHCSCADVSS